VEILRKRAYDGAFTVEVRYRVVSHDDFEPYATVLGTCQYRRGPRDDGDLLCIARAL
jgi:hypothetical protein